MKQRVDGPGPGLIRHQITNCGDLWTPAGFPQEPLSSASSPAPLCITTSTGRRRRRAGLHRIINSGRSHKLVVAAIRSSLTCRTSCSTRSSAFRRVSARWRAPAAAVDAATVSGRRAVVTVDRLHRGHESSAEPAWPSSPSSDRLVARPARCRRTPMAVGSAAGRQRERTRARASGFLRLVKPRTCRHMRARTMQAPARVARAAHRREPSRSSTRALPRTRAIASRKKLRADSRFGSRAELLLESCPQIAIGHFRLLATGTRRINRQRRAARRYRLPACGTVAFQRGRRQARRGTWRVACPRRLRTSFSDVMKRTSVRFAAPNR